MKKLTHFFGEKDGLQKIGAVLWSGRWPVMRTSAWNKAVNEGRIQMVNLGPMAHNSYGGYYDVRAVLPGGEDHCVFTAEAVKNTILSLPGPDLSP